MTVLPVDPDLNPYSISEAALQAVPLEVATLQRVLAAAEPWAREGTQPPWGFVRVCAPALRSRLEALVRDDPITGAAAHAGGARSAHALRQAQEVLAVVLPSGGWSGGTARLDVALVARAVQALWLAARAEGLGMGWLAGFDPAQLAQLLGLPRGSQPVALLCLGGLPLGLHALDVHAQPAVDGALRAQQPPLAPQWFEDRWGQRPAGAGVAAA